MSRGFLDEDAGADDARETSDRRMVEIAGTFKRVHKQAALFNDGARDVWVPFSIPTPRLGADVKIGPATIVVPEWWAKKNRLI
jgi:hypothetical protein